MSGRQTRLAIIRQSRDLPVRWAPQTPWWAVALPRHARPPAPGEWSAAGLVSAIRTLLRRGAGAQGWVSPYRHDPIAFLIDAVSTPVRVWSSEGELIFENAASRGRRDLRSLERPDRAEQEATGRRIERRVLTFQHKGDELTLEVITSTFQDVGPRT